ncbi:Alpha-glucosidase III [[Clostridium] ultunense Esp]|nr:Alpha-glucosidase III [[Clostridium] ultunense Esp]
MYKLEQCSEVSMNPKSIELVYPSQAKIKITSPHRGILHFQVIRITPWSEDQAESSYSVLDEDPLLLEAEDQEEILVIQSGEGWVRIHKNPFHVELYSLSGDLLLTGRNPHILLDGWRSRLHFSFQEGERIYGLGEWEIEEEGMKLDHRGRIRHVWNNHLPAPSRLLLPILYSSKGFGLFIDNPWPARFDFGVEDEEGWFYESEGGNLSYYLFLGENLKELVRKYHLLTGRPPIPPRFAFGYLQSKFGYRTRQEVEELAATFRQKGIPCDAIILDLYWFKKMGDLQFNRDAFPHPEEMVARLREMGFHVILIEEPYVVKESRLYPEGNRLQIFGKKADGTTYLFPFWAGESALVDFTDPLAKQWWADRHKDLIKMGVGGWWTDLNEPEVHPIDMIHHDGPAHKVHNIYALEMQKAVALAYEQNAPDQRLLIMSRSAWSGSHRYGVGVWSGDVSTTWDHLRKQPGLALSMSLAGISLWNSDIGGFTGDEPSAELFLRWIQFGTFTPLMRPHGAHQAREPWAFGEEMERKIRKFIELRYRLLPYIYSLAYIAFDAGLPYMRPLIMEDPTDLEAADMEETYLFGPHLLVAPILEEGSRKRTLYLPKGKWFHYWSDVEVEGGRWIEVEAPLEEIPLFVRAGAILPFLPVMQHTEEEKWKELHLIVYPGEGNGLLLYEDDGKTTEYQKGSYRLTRYRMEILGKNLLIEIYPAYDRLEDGIKDREWTIEILLRRPPAHLFVNNEEWNTFLYKEGRLILPLGLRSVNQSITLLIQG